MSALAEQPLQQPVDYRTLRIAGEQFGKAPSELNAGEIQQLQRIAANEQGIEQLVLNSEEARHVSVPDNQVSAALDQIKQRYENNEQFLEALTHNGLDEDDIRDGLKRELRVEAVMDLIASRAVRVDETEATMYYYLNQDKFKKPETRSARHILITVNDAYAENSRDAAHQRLTTIADRIGWAPHRFSEQAQKHSECPSGMHGGVLGELKAGVLYPQLDKALFEMAEGEIRGPLESDIGWHLLLCEKIDKERIMPVDEVLPRLQEELQHRQNKREQKLWLKRCAESRA